MGLCCKHHFTNSRPNIIRYFECVVTCAVGSMPVGDAMLKFNNRLGPLMTNTNPLDEYTLDIGITADESANVSIMAIGFQPFAFIVSLTPDGIGEFNFELTPE
ncbi:MAG: hypothetical protein Q8K70_09730 [Bacteroidota bacterium]|nr:hypothetical protein [Bacteroidota bacterium]